MTTSARMVDCPARRPPTPMEVGLVNQTLLSVGTTTTVQIYTISRCTSHKMELGSLHQRRAAACQEAIMDRETAGRVSRRSPCEWFLRTQKISISTDIIPRL